MDNGVLKVGKKYADKLTNETADPWFEMIGESSTALLLKLYSQVRQILFNYRNYREIYPFNVKKLI